MSERKQLAGKCYTEARELHNAGDHVSAEARYRETGLLKGGLSPLQAMYHSDCLLMLGRLEDAAKILRDLSSKVSTEQEKTALRNRKAWLFDRVFDLADRRTDLNGVLPKRPPKSDIPMPFYISSLGGTATAWISAALSSHPDIVCYHGTRSVPPISSDEHRAFASPEDFHMSLVESQYSTRWRKVFGAIHGYHGTEAKAAFEHAGGYFCGIIRHPIDRLHSLAHRHLAEMFDGKVDVLGAIQQLAEEQPESSLLARARFRFVKTLQLTYSYDLQLDNECGQEHLYRMEDLSTKPEVFSTLVSRVTCGHIHAEQSYLSSIFSIDDQHRRVSRSGNLYTMERWPSCIREDVSACLDRIGRQAFRNLYEKYGYDVTAITLC